MAAGGLASRGGGAQSRARCGGGGGSRGAWRTAPPFIGARDARSPGRARPGGAAADVAASASGRWASRGPGGLERVGPSGSVC
jgi:hypothetical protein